MFPRRGLCYLLLAGTFTVPVYSAPSFYQFGAGEKLTYECSFTNDLGITVHAWDGYLTDENCVAIGYYFPGDGALCYDDIPL